MDRGNMERFKTIIRKILSKVGIDKKYTLCLPYGYYTYSPWLEDWFQEIYSKIRDQTIVKEDRCYIIYEFCNHSLHLKGNFAECGVYKGGTAFIIANTLKNKNKQLHLFDTFAGMPDMANKDQSSHKKGDFGDVSLNAVENILRRFPFVVFHQGLIPKTFKAIKDEKFAFVHIDVDLYQTTKDCCSFFYNRMISGGVMIFDDYGFRYEYPAKRAVDEFFKGKPESPISLRTGQCIVIISNKV